jgi:hypothetical protein
MLFLKDDFDDFIHVSCERCGQKFRITRGICKIEDRFLRVTREIDCHNCRCKSNIIKNVPYLDIQYNSQFDVDTDVEKLKNGEEIQTNVGIIEWYNDDKGKFEKARLFAVGS